MGVDIVLKATKVDGVYTADPKKDATARRYADLTFDEAIVKNLQGDGRAPRSRCAATRTCCSRCSRSSFPGALKRVVLGEDEGTLVHC